MFGPFKSKIMVLLYLSDSSLAKFRNGTNESLYILRSREAVVAVLYQRQYDIVLCEARNQFDCMPPWHIGICNPLQDAHRTSGFDQPAEQKMSAAIFD